MGGMRPGLLVRLNSADLGTVGRDRDDVLAEAIAHCGDDPEAQDAKRLLEGFQRDGRDVGQEGGRNG